MTTTTRQHTLWWRLVLAATAAVLATLLGAGTASATTLPELQNRVGASTPVVTHAVGPHESVSPGQQWSNAPPTAGTMVATGVATNTVPGAPKVGPGAALENITGGEALRIQNAADRIGHPVSLVGSRASGTSGAFSDWDYVITGIKSSTKHSVSSSLPRGATELGVGRQIDVFTGPLDDALPHITFFPRGG